ncbi:MAG: hypothetical protein HXS48_24190 [Theionarchaea archaeon]|nr:hypothetical protein [Theionarchaea archaeon]
MNAKIKRGDTMSSGIVEGHTMGFRYALASKLEESDWRGIIALILVVGYLFLLATADTNLETISAILSGPVGLIVGYYFGQSSR